MKPLSEKERRFVEAYMGEAAGNGAAAAKCAGYKGSVSTLSVQANRLLKKACVQLSIAERRTALESQSIASVKERREILTQMARGAGIEPRDKAKAIDVLNKMDALYVVKHADPDGKPLIPAGSVFTFAVTQIPGSENRT